MDAFYSCTYEGAGGSEAVLTFGSVKGTLFAQINIGGGGRKFIDFMH